MALASCRSLLFQAFIAANCDCWALTLPCQPGQVERRQIKCSQMPTSPPVRATAPVHQNETTRQEQLARQPALGTGPAAISHLPLAMLAWTQPMFDFEEHFKPSKESQLGPPGQSTPLSRNELWSSYFRDASTCTIHDHLHKKFSCHGEVSYAS